MMSVRRFRHERRSRRAYQVGSPGRLILHPYLEAEFGQLVDPHLTQRAGPLLPVLFLCEQR